MYSDRRGGGRGGFGGGGGGFGRREGGGGYGGDYQQRGGGGGGGWGDSHGDNETSMKVDQRHVGRIIGKGGSKIREIQDTSGAHIKVNSQHVEDGQVRIVLTGSAECCSHAQDLIKDITEYFNGQYGGDRGGGGGGRFGGRRDDYEGGGRRTCYKCGGEGHFARDCTSADSYQRGGGGGGGRGRSQTCYRCGEEGHMARDCSGGY